MQKTFHGLHTIKITIKNVLYGEVAYDVINSKHCWFLDKNIMYKFSLTNILNKFEHHWRLQTNNFDKLIFVNKNWPNDPKFGCTGSKTW